MKSNLAKLKSELQKLLLSLIGSKQSKPSKNKGSAVTSSGVMGIEKLFYYFIAALVVLVIIVTQLDFGSIFPKWLIDLVSSWWFWLGLVVIIAIIFGIKNNKGNSKNPWGAIGIIVGILGLILLIKYWPFDWPTKSESQNVTIGTSSPVAVTTTVPNNCQTCYSEKQDHQLKIGTNYFEKGKKYWFYRGCTTSFMVVKSSKNGLLYSTTMFGAEDKNHWVYKINTEGDILEKITYADNFDYGNYYVTVDKDAIIEIQGKLE